MSTTLLASVTSLGKQRLILSHSCWGQIGAQLPSRAAIDFVAPLPVHIPMTEHTGEGAVGLEVARVMLPAVQAILPGRCLATKHDTAVNRVKANEATFAVIAEAACEPVLGIECDNFGAAQVTAMFLEMKPPKHSA
jgi:hypothetical protein